MAQTSREAVIARVTEIVERVGQAENIEVVDVEFSGNGKARILRVFIDKPAGITHADCEFVSNEASGVLDAEDLIPGGSYHLEVSSPGVERKLSKPADFQRFAGQKARITLREPVEERRHWEGILRGIGTDNAVALEPPDGKLVHIPLEYVRKANLKFDW